MNAGVDKQTLAILVSLCEQGVNPEALAAVVLELRKEAGATGAPEKVLSRCPCSVPTCANPFMLRI